MQKISLLIISLIAGMFVFFACQRQLGPDLPADHSETTVNADVQGRITTEDGLPLQNVRVTSGGKTAFTDENGIFRIDDVELSRRFGFVKAEKAGYFEGSRSVMVNPDAVNFVEIGLLERNQKGGFATADGGTILVEDGQTVSFDPNSVITESTKIPYTGAVTVYAAWLDPTAPNLGRIMPGDLRGMRTTGEESAMQPYGMLVVELEGESGEKLQLAPDQKATLTMTIPASLLAMAPASIPLWYFDTATGRWIEEGESTKQGDSYVGTVSHFTVWNCDRPMDFVDLKLKLQDQNDQPFTYGLVKVINSSNQSYGTAYTDSLGYARLWVPKNTALSLEVYNKCGDVLLTRSLSSAGSDLDLGTLSVTLSPAVSLNIAGTVTDCADAPVADGLASVYLEGLHYSAPVKNGSFSLLIDRCGNSPATAYITVGDLAGEEQSKALPLDVSAGPYNAGALRACGTELAAYFNFKLDGTDYALADSLLVNFNAGIARIEVTGTVEKIYISFDIPGTAPGTYTGSLRSFEVNNERYRSDGTLNTAITATGQPGDFITGSFDGSVIKDSTSAAVPLTGSFRIKRVN